MREAIEERVRELAEEHPSYGYRKIWALAHRIGPRRGKDGAPPTTPIHLLDDLDPAREEST